MAIVLPHGVLFRGGSEGEIRKRLLEKNRIDTIIGLPSSLFSNTGIPVTILILKKNRELDDPVLIIDSSKDFIKVGKQNVLQEKHIAKIVDTYVEKRVEEGYSALVYREDIVENDFNMNIPRYIEAKSEEIPHDVDAHLLGGIPEEDIKNLEILNDLASDVLATALKEERKGYVKLTKEIDNLMDEILKSEEISEKSSLLEKNINDYINKYWDILREINGLSNIKEIKDNMLGDIKEILARLKHVNTYDGYQLIAEIWRESLTKDLELISANDFYSAARTREPNMVMRGSGSNRREEQDGWNGSLIPNELLINQLYSDEQSEIEELNQDLLEFISQIDELVEAAKIEDTEENDVLFECLTKNSEGEPGNAFLVGAVNSEIKEHDSKSDEFKILNKVKTLLSNRTKTNREIREKESELKELVEDRILTLTEEEIDILVYEKWFGSLVENMLELIEKPLEKELQILRELDNRYKSTLEDLDEEYIELESTFEKMLDELVKR